MSNDKMREEYESELCKRGYGEIYRDADPASSVEYENGYFQFGWTMFKASRESLVIELPMGGYWAGYDNEHMMESRDVRDAIEAAGVKVKP